jgi:hypothetical protein
MPRRLLIDQWIVSFTLPAGCPPRTARPARRARAHPRFPARLRAAVRSVMAAVPAFQAARVSVTR